MREGVKSKPRDDNTSTSITLRTLKTCPKTREHPSLSPVYGKPFCWFAEYVKTESWGRLVDDLQNWSITANSGSLEALLEQVG